MNQNDSKWYKTAHGETMKHVATWNQQESVNKLKSENEIKKQAA